MTRVRTVRCNCCGHDRTVYVTDDGEPAQICETCRSHAGSKPADVARREATHSAMFRELVADAEDAAFLAQSERDFYRNQLTVTGAERRTLALAMANVQAVHHYAGGACTCGLEDCPVADVVSTPTVARLLGTYDEQMQTLRELRRANPNAIVAVSAEIDPSLIYRHEDSHAEPDTALRPAPRRATS